MDPLCSCDFRPDQAHRGNNPEPPVATQNGRMRMTPQEPTGLQCVRTFFGYMAHHLTFVLFEGRNHSHSTLDMHKPSRPPRRRGKKTGQLPTPNPSTVSSASRPSNSKLKFNDDVLMRIRRFCVEAVPPARKPHQKKRCSAQPRLAALMRVSKVH